MDVKIIIINQSMSPIFRYEISSLLSSNFIETWDYHWGGQELKDLCTVLLPVKVIFTLNQAFTLLLAIWGILEVLQLLLGSCESVTPINQIWKQTRINIHLWHVYNQ